MFKNDHYGVGYYKDEVPEKAVTYDTIMEEMRAKRLKASRGF